MFTEKEKDRLKSYLANHTSSILKLEDAYVLISKALRISVVELKTVEYDLFYKVIKSLEEDNVIKPYGKGMNAMMLKSVALKFKIIDYKKKEESMSQEDKHFLHSLNSKINTFLYFKNKEILNKDRENLKKLSNFLNSLDDNVPYISLNERSYELFGYEKCLSGVEGKDSLLKNTKITLDDIHCFDTYTPLQCYIMHNFYKKDIRTVLIVENLDTYWSFHRAMNESPLGEYIDMLVYGGGNKSSGNFKFHRHYSITSHDNIYYFGDVDPEGLAIYQRVKKANPKLNIKLAKNLYKLAIKVGMKKGLYNIHNDNQTKLDEEEIDELLKSLDEKTAQDFKNILLNGKYIPQEALNYRVLLENTR